jgi:hypothetical protein
MNILSFISLNLTIFFTINKKLMDQVDQKIEDEIWTSYKKIFLNNFVNLNDLFRYD